MYRAFNVTLDPNGYLGYVNTQQYENDKSISLQKLQKIINSRDIIQAWEIKKLLLPSKRYDIFISHSHKDLELAKGFANYLYLFFNVTCFIDSLYWGNIDELQNGLNELHLTYDGVTKKSYYDYEKTLQVAKHANMILASALTEMIDRCECVFFLNTDNSVISGAEAINKNETYSPWIYHEVFTTSIIHRKGTGRRAALEEHQIRDNAIKPLPQFIYNLDLTGMTNLNDDDILNWGIIVNNNNTYPLVSNNTHPLDILYKLKPEQK